MHSETAHRCAAASGLLDAYQHCTRPISTPVRCLPPLQLTIEVVEQLRKMFQPDPRMIKKQVESLIDREYLERDTVRGAQGLGSWPRTRCVAFIHPPACCLGFQAAAAAAL